MAGFLTKNSDKPVSTSQIYNLVDPLPVMSEVQIKSLQLIQKASIRHQ